MNKNNMELMVFAYDFPHFKTQEFLFRLLVEGYEIAYVIGAPWKQLGVPTPTLRDAPSYVGMMHPRDICRRFGIEYVTFDHNSIECENFIKNRPISLGVISGARILKGNIIRQFGKGIINIHPGLLPWIRGLDTLKWSVYKDCPIGNTAHMINEKIDAGQMICKEQVSLKRDDTMVDIWLRIVQVQPGLLIKALKILEDEDIELENLDNLNKEYFTSMSPEIEKKIPDMFNDWLKKYSV